MTNAVEAPIVIEYFYEPGCSACLEVSETIMPRLKERFEGLFRVIERDIGAMSNYLELVRYQETFGGVKNEPVYMVINDRYLFSGLAEIKGGLIERMASITNRLPVGGGIKAQSSAHGTGPSVADQNLLTRRFKQFTPFAVMTAGFVDGINPCAISTLVFFMSVLSISKVRGQQLKIVGVWYCLASFLTYTLIGFGLLSALHRLSVFRMARIGIEWGMVVILAIFAFLSFRDALRFRATGDPDSVVLQIPHGIKVRMHSLMRAAPGGRSLAVAAFGVGAVVTVLESVCTGQVYAPTLVLVIKSGYSVYKGLTYLLLYNVMFILPLVAIFILTYRGLQFQKLLEWSRRNVVSSKALSGCLFIVLAWLIIML